MPSAARGLPGRSSRDFAVRAEILQGVWMRARCGLEGRAPLDGPELDAPAGFSETFAMYKIVGADQKEYGPITADQIRQWIAEGRANAQTLARFEDGPWKPLSTFPELVSALGPIVPPPLGAVPPALGLGTPIVARKNNGLALTGLILGALGVVQCCTPLFAILGLVFSCLGFYQTKQDPGRYTGIGLAKAGIIMSVAGLVIFGFLFFTGILSELAKNLPRFGR
jgi:hypothetical protein